MINTIDGVQANSAAPLFRVVGGAVVASCRPVPGQECFGAGAAASRVESVSGTSLTGARQALGLRGYEGLAQVGGRVHQLPEQVGGQREVLLAHIDGSDNGTSSFNGSTTGTKPMTPWDFRTSSPPG